jgi:hypothetical protein
MVRKVELQNLIAQQTECIQRQLGEIAALESKVAALQAEIDRLTGGNSPDALTVLQRLYVDKNLPVSVIIKAASEALGYERPRMPVLSIGMDVSDFAARLAAQRRGELIEATAEDPDEADAAG